MVVRILSLRIQWILYISMCPWLLTYGLGQFKCPKNETMNILWCGELQFPHKCNIFKCVQTDAERIKRGYVLWSHQCKGGNNPTYGYQDKYIWTKDCCLILAGICYEATSVDSEEESTNNGQASHGQASTMKTTKFEGKFTTPEDIFNSTGIVDMVEQTVPTVLEIETEKYTETKSVMTSAMKTTQFEKMFTTPVDIFNRTGKVDTVEPTVHTVLEMKANKYTETNSAMIGLYAGLPVGLFLFVAVLAVVCYIFRDKLKILVGKFRKRHKEGLYQESGTTSKQSTRNDISRTFANQEYAMHDEQENRKSENTPTGVYDFFKSWSEPEQNGSFHHNPIETEANSSCSKYRPGYEELGVGESCNTYNTIGEAADRGGFDPTYNHIHGSNVSATDMRQGNKGGTEYDNAFI